MTEVHDHRWIDRDDDLRRVVDELVEQPRYALDTEFHRERTYYPRLALVQIAWPGGLVLIDPVAADVRELARLFDADVLGVLHAAQQDLDVLTHAVGAVPARLYDTQLAAAFVGYGTPSLGALLQGEIDVNPAKGDRLTDWLQRPLTDAQRAYAAADVAYLLEVHDRLEAKLGELGRRSWAEEACNELLAKPVTGAAPDDAWMKLKDTRALRPRGRAVARAVAGWRERRAMRLDLPVRQVLPDLAVLGIAQRQPTSEKELANTRGVDARSIRGSLADELLDAVRTGLASEPPTDPRSTGDDLDRDLRPAVTLVSAWISQVAKVERIDTAMLATRADLVALLSGDPDARLAHGWRAELLGDGIRDLVAGRAGLTFDTTRGLRLVELDPAAAS
ncbi:MAG: HRDC domain-containing protein [Ilumatobacteraceae bacterium]